MLFQATVNGVGGDVTIGLWQACADMPCEESDDAPDASCKVEPVFSDIGTCRQGHCIRGKGLTPGSSWEANNLCDRSAAGSAFSVIGILLMLYYTKITTIEKLLRRQPVYEAAAWISGLAGFSGLIAFGVWARWVQVMNNAEGEGRESDTDRILLTKMKLGFGFWLQVITALLCFLNGLLCAWAHIEM
jgi:hypothetical protein